MDVVLFKEALLPFREKPKVATQTSRGIHKDRPQMQLFTVTRRVLMQETAKRESTT